jgi:ceramide glucosyltransferase
MHLSRSRAPPATNTISFRFFSRKQPPSVSSNLAHDAPAVTIIRPVKGIEPHLYDCIASTFRQDYPLDKISIRLCVEDERDPSYPILQKLVHDFPEIDVRIFVESQDPVLHGSTGHTRNLGPNPKIRNISRAYREANGDLIWIIDCNVWVATGVLGRMVDKLSGFSPNGTSSRPYKFVHHMPLVVDVINYSEPAEDDKQSLSALLHSSSPVIDGTAGSSTPVARVSNNGGGRLDEMFMATTHAKFYGAINSVGVAPCIVGKSNMFRKSHLEQVTSPSRNPLLPKNNARPSGVDYFSHNICEDHLIGDLLWRSDIPGFLNHGIAWGDLVIQPMAGMSVALYAARRVRWLRARKFTVLAATLVEPGIEAFLWSAYFSFAVTTLPWFHRNLGIPQTWTAMPFVSLLCLSLWIVVDWFTSRHLHSGKSVQVDHYTPAFARGTKHAGGMPRRPFHEWLPAWIGREALALPIWTLAVLLGTTVSWRGKTFKVNMNTTVVEMAESSSKTSKTPESERGVLAGKDKDRLD